VARFISKRPNLTYILRSDEQILVAGPGGIQFPRSAGPPLVAQFQAGCESSYEQEVAIAHFTGRAHTRRDGTLALNGASPSAVSQPVYNGQNELTGKTEPFRVESFLGTFDTDWLDPADREYAIDALHREASFGIDYIEVSPAVLAPPWPNYDQVTGNRAGTVAVKIAAKVVEDGYDVALVIAYEEENKNRTDVLEALRAIGESDAQREFEDAALTVEV